MDLTKIINKKDEAAQYMIDEITHIIKTFDKRDPGSRGEREACQYMAEVLQKDCGCEQADVEPFKENPGSFYGWIYFTITFVIVGIALSFFASAFTKPNGISLYIFHHRYYYFQF